MLLQDSTMVFSIHFKQKLPTDNQRKIDQIAADQKKLQGLLDVLTTNFWNFIHEISDEEQFITVKKAPVQESSLYQESSSGMVQPQFSQSSIKPQILHNLTSQSPIQWLGDEVNGRQKYLNYHEHTGRRPLQHEIISISSSLTQISQRSQFVDQSVSDCYPIEDDKISKFYRKQHSKQVSELKRQIAYRMTVYLKNDAVAQRCLPKRILVFSHLEKYLKNPQEAQEDKAQVLDAIMEVLRDAELWEHYLKINNAKTLKLDFIIGIKSRLEVLINQYRPSRLKLE